MDGKLGQVNMYDNKSSNHTWIDNQKLNPHARYIIIGGEKLKFGNVSAIFQTQRDTGDNRSSNNESTHLADTSK